MQVPDYKVVILGAGKSMRNDLPPAMVPIGKDRRVLDWMLDAFSCLPNVEINFVSGYMAQEVMGQYPGIRFHHNAEWEHSGPAKSLSLAPIASRIATFICYSDVVFRLETIRRMMVTEHDLLVAVDHCWKDRYDGRSASEINDAEKVILEGQTIREISKGESPAADAEFTGLVRMSGKTAQRLQNVLTSSIFKAQDGLPEVIHFLVKHGVTAQALDVDGEWAELNAPQDLARFVLGTKAESLSRLRPLVEVGKIGEIYRFNYGQWKQDRADVLNGIEQTFGADEVIVRSSALSEDGWKQSSAGAYLSIPHLPCGDRLALTKAIDEVFESYDDQRDANQILVQEMLTRVQMSGVVMTRTSGLGAPYYVFNYDDTTARTDTVTSGEGDDTSTLFLHRQRSLSAEQQPHLSRVLEAVRELEELVGHDSLDVEFAVTEDDSVHILQVRPIVVTNENRALNDAAIHDGIRNACRFFEDLQAQPPFVVGGFTHLSVMSDWNPAEIIGTKPAQLALSLYRYIITDETWARQRAEYGYRDVRPCNLLVDLIGHPYVDVRATFNSFVPATLSEDFATRLVEHYLHHLAESPELHDKVEFDILHTCWTFELSKRLGLLQDDGFSAVELKELEHSLLEITRNGLERCESDYASLASAQERSGRIRQSQIDSLSKAFALLENARTQGALLFSHLARAGFVAVSLLRSLVGQGIITRQEMDAFLGSLRTTPSRLQSDAIRVSKGELAWDDFQDAYGHLRPGTYDINSPSYGEVPDEFLRPMVDKWRTDAAPVEGADFHWEPDTVSRVSEALKQSDLGTSFESFERFLRLAIEGREYGKFVFTRDLSEALESLAEFGAEHFLSREDLSHIAISDLLALRSASFRNASARMQELSAAGRQSFRVSQAICLPDQIFRTDEITCFEYRKASPNYITSCRVRGPVVCLTHRTRASTDLDGKIVLIPNADPGFDWIFTRNILGLITMYGGANSHMAIRMAEFKLPGVTGLGQLQYEAVRAASVLELDCAGHHVRVVN